MKKILIMLLMPFSLMAQTFESVKIKYQEPDKYLKNYTIVEFKDRNHPEEMSVNIPVVGMANIHKVDIHPDVILSDGVFYDDTPIYNYQGTVDGGTIALTFYNGGVSGMAITTRGNIIIGKFKDKIIIYNDLDLSHNNTFECTELECPFSSPVLPSITPSTTHCVNWYWETTKELFDNKGSAANVNAYIQSLFNQIKLFYSNDGLSIGLQTLFIWTSPDPYTGTNTTDRLDEFGAYRTSYNGDFAHLIGLTAQGGIAWVNTMCIQYPQYKMAYSGVTATFNNIPTYSWTVNCIAHEQGHNLGSNHTHDCVWNGNNTRIDDCGTHAGAAQVGLCGADIPDPVGGGTLMSYCQLRLVGTNLSLGFGAQPLAVVTNSINNATCLGNSCCSPVSVSSITGLSSVHKGDNNISYSVSPIAGATFNWTLPPYVNGFSSTNSISINFAEMYSGGLICASTSTCGIASSSCINVSILLNRSNNFYDIYGRHIDRPESGIYFILEGERMKLVIK